MNTGRQRMSEGFDRNALKNLIHHQQVDKQFAECTINLMKLGSSVTLQKSGRPVSVTTHEKEM